MIVPAPTVLVVDDDGRICRDPRTSPEQEDHEAGTILTGEGPLRATFSKIDVNLSGTSGLDSLHRLRADGPRGRHLGRSVLRDAPFGSRMASMDDARFELFAYWRTSATYRVRVALNLKGLAASERIVDLDAGEQRGEAFLRINPLGAIPALIDRDAEDAPPITQSLTETARFDPDAIRAWRVNWFTAGLQAVERRLAREDATGTFCHGDAITLADICLASIKIVLPIFRIEVPDTPMVDRIFAACEAHPAFADAAPMRQVGAPS